MLSYQKFYYLCFLLFGVCRHEGPGMGSDPRDRTFFDPVVYRIILFDQRGAGKSIPSAELKVEKIH